MKTLSRMLIILIAALVVAGVAYALLPAAISSAGPGQPLGLDAANGQMGPSQPASGTGNFSGERIDRGSDRGGSFETIAINFLIIAALVVSVQGVWAMGRIVDKHYVVRS